MSFLFSFNLIYIFVRFLLLIPLISQPILHILSHPFPLPFYSMSFCFIHTYLYFSFSFNYSLIFVCLFQHPFFFSFSLAIACLFLFLSLFPFLPFILLPQSFDIISFYLASDFTLFTFSFCPIFFCPIPSCLSLHPHHFPLVVPLIVPLFSYFPVPLLLFRLYAIHISCFHILRIPSVFFPLPFVNISTVV